MKFIYSDGGRSNYFTAQRAGDCVTRAICNATGKDYLEVYKALKDLAKGERTGKRKKRVSSVRDGVYPRTAMKYIKDTLGFRWVALSGIGVGVTTHLNELELPSKGTYILRVSRHLTCWKDGVLVDTFDCSRRGTRAVYGYWVISNN